MNLRRSETHSSGSDDKDASKEGKPPSGWQRGTDGVDDSARRSVSRHDASKRHAEMEEYVGGMLGTDFEGLSVQVGLLCLSVKTFCSF